MGMKAGIGGRFRRAVMAGFLWAGPVAGMAGAAEQDPAIIAAGDAAAGRKVFTVCKNCHSVRQDQEGRFGPNLYQVVGRGAGSRPDYAYSDAMKAADWDWTPANIDRFLSDPKAMVPGTKMILPPITDAADRADVIAYLIRAGAR